LTNRGKIGESLYLAFPRDLLAILSLLDRNLSVQLRTILLCLVFFQLPHPSHARTNHLFENFSTERGLAGRLVRDIVQDEHGFIWFATESGLSRYDGYQFKNYYHDASDSNSLASSDIWRLHVDTNNNLWIASAAGLDRFDGVVFNHYSHRGMEDRSFFQNIRAITSSKGKLYVGTSLGVVRLSLKQDNTQIPEVLLSKQGAVHSLITLNNGEILASTSAGVYLQTPLKQKFEPWLRGEIELPKNIRRMHFDQKNSLWISTNNQLFLINLADKIVEPILPEISQHFITDLVFLQGTVWIGTLRNGVYKINRQQPTEHFIYNAQLKDSIQDNVIASLFIDSSDTLWVGTFNSGVGFRNNTVNSFDLYHPKTKGLECLQSRVFNHLSKSSEGLLFVGTANGFYELDLQKNSCKNIDLSSVSTRSVVAVYSVYAESRDSIYIGSSAGLLHYNRNTHNLINIAEATINAAVYFIQLVGDKLLVGTHKKIFRVDLDQKSAVAIKMAFNNTDNNGGNYAGANQVAQLPSGELIFASSRGLLKLDSTDTLVLLAPNGHSVLNSSINAVVVDSDGLWVGNNGDRHLFQFTYEGKFLAEYPLSKKQSSIKPLSMVSVPENLWIGSSAGLFKFNKKTKVMSRFVSSDGLQSDIFVRNSAFQDSNGTLFFGGRNGFNSFNPDRVTSNNEPPKMVLTELRRFNQIIEPVVDEAEHDGFTIDEPLESLTQLELSHRDVIMSLQFSGLHFSDPTRNRYAYKIEGLHSDWIETDANNRTVALTNLSPGDYIFRARAANKDGRWNAPLDDIELPIKVFPAPWFSWWAYILYSLTFIGSVLLFIHHRISGSIRRATELANEVEERTQEITAQKVVIESLLERKDTLFANISHEFRTPLTLILGPLEKELKMLDKPKDVKNLQMIQRNANRLLGMVEQILKLTELKKEEGIQKVPQAINPVLDSLVESFKPLAASKNISLKLKTMPSATVLASFDSLEVMLGNLISNAIKYTPKNGYVEVFGDVSERNIEITVKDSGVGMSEQQQTEIFERFVRLDGTSDIAGTGIGLSIVKELILAHSGKISVISELNQGAAFTLRIPRTDEKASMVMPKINSINHLVTVEGERLEDSVSPESGSGDSELGLNETILIIEDNLDMQQYINSCLENVYRCIASERGEEGIKTAILLIPDLIICDVMMPGIDGYQVVNRLRNDERTSHIPIILLTAKGDKASRIQGWNENIDGYMTKPFDQAELMARIANILSVRGILKSKNVCDVMAATNREKPSASIESVNLNSLDKQFIARLISEIETYYFDHQYNSTQMASKLAMSPRQLQRKLNALIDKSPMDLLRQYRLKKASGFLLEGHQISVVANKCGFNSLSYFSQCFKAEYGLTPKQHQSYH
jgi:signal transduction histidine kinase/ligand-binding sensor domain-containing protein/DNA-binding response OmpR family regulator